MCQIYEWASWQAQRAPCSSSSSHDLKRRWITNVSPLVLQDFMSRNEFESQLFYLKRRQISSSDDLITALPAIISTCLYGSCKSARLKRRCLDAPLSCDDELRMVEGTDAPLRNISTGNRGSKHLSFPWVVTLLSSVLITTIIVDVLGNLLVIVSVFRNRKLRKAGKCLHLCNYSCWQSGEVFWSILVIRDWYHWLIQNSFNFFPSVLW